MSTPFPSIQSFFSREVALEGEDASSSPTNPGDGFTSSEVEAVVHPSSRPFRPSRQYDTCPIAELYTGMHNYRITGRLVNFSSATGYYFLVLSDGTAAIAVSLACLYKERNDHICLQHALTHLPDKNALHW